jgi:hypothetical protein
VDRAAALEVLGLTADASHDAVKRRFRQLAHDLHPDRGGDPARFQAVHAATRVLLEAPDRIAPPRVARGRPSRAPSDGTGSIGATGVGGANVLELRDEDLVPLRDDERRAAEQRMRTGALDALLLTRLLIDASSLLLISRAPGSRTNRLAPMLDVESASILHVRRAPTATGILAPRGSGIEGTRLELLARGRAARRALAAAPVDALRAASWRRERGDTTIVLAGAVRADADPRRTARLTTAAVLELLDVLRWPLAQWALGAPPARRPTVEPPAF